MRRWGVVVTACYALLLLAIVFPAGLALIGEWKTVFFAGSLSVFLTPWTWVLVPVLGACEALLLFLSVDTSFKRMRPRRHIALSIALTSFFAGLLLVAGVCAFIAGLYGGGGFPYGDLGEHPILLLALPGLWLIWAVVFYLHMHGSPRPVSAAVAWLLKGSVMELLIAVPAHVVVRQRGDCSAPILTSFGIVTGIAVMLFAFGPGVLALYKKRFDAYRRTGTQGS